MSAINGVYMNAAQVARMARCSTYMVLVAINRGELPSHGEPNGKRQQRRVALDAATTWATGVEKMRAMRALAPKPVKAKAAPTTPTEPDMPTAIAIGRAVNRMAAEQARTNELLQELVTLWRK